MAIADRVQASIRELLGISTYANGLKPSGPAIDSTSVEQVREAMGGQLQMLQITPTRWYAAHVEQAAQESDQGRMQMVGQLWRAMRRDGLIYGLTKTRTSGLVALPKRFRGDKAACDALTADNGTRSMFDEMCPPQELAQLAADGIGCGVGVAELLPVEGRDFPVLVRLDPQFLWYRWNENRWYFQSIAGLLPITPGDGHWVLYTPGGRLTPWQTGVWPSVARAFIAKEHALLHRSNYVAKLANPARVIQAPQGSTEDQRLGFMSKVASWGINTVFELLPGWEAKVLESNGRGWEVFGTEVETANLEIMIALAGQVVTVTGGTGFANASIHATIRADLIKETADTLAHCLNTQVLPQWAIPTYGDKIEENLPRVSWDTSPPVDRTAEATSLKTTAEAMQALAPVLAAAGIELDAQAMVDRFGVPITGKEIPPEPLGATVASDETGSEGLPPGGPTGA